MKKSLSNCSSTTKNQTEEIKVHLEPNVNNFGKKFQKNLSLT